MKQSSNMAEGVGKNNSNVSHVALSNYTSVLQVGKAIKGTSSYIS